MRKNYVNLRLLEIDTHVNVGSTGLLKLHTYASVQKAKHLYNVQFSLFTCSFTKVSLLNKFITALYTLLTCTYSIKTTYQIIQNM